MTSQQLQWKTKGSGKSVFIRKRRKKSDRLQYLSCNSIIQKDKVTNPGKTKSNALHIQEIAYVRDSWHFGSIKNDFFWDLV